MHTPFQHSIVGIQYLRGVAALMVVALHAGMQLPSIAPWTNAGSAGVDVFFVISGWIMAHSTRGFDPDGDREGQAQQFILRRIARIVPLYWLGLLWTIKVPLVHGTFTFDYFRDFLFIPRMHSSGHVWPELVAGWTLNYEMFFYLAFALSMLAGRARYWVLTGVLGGVVLLGVSEAERVSAFFTSPLLLEFLGGVALFHLNQRIHVSRGAGLALLLASVAALMLDNGTAHRAFADGIPAAGIVLAVVKLTPSMRPGPLSFLGDASYSVYLFHLGVISLIGHAIDRGFMAGVPAIAVWLLMLAAGLAAGVAIYLFIERQLTRIVEHAIGARRRQKCVTSQIRPTPTASQPIGPRV